MAKKPSRADRMYARSPTIAPADGGMTDEEMENYNEFMRENRRQNALEGKPNIGEEPDKEDKSLDTAPKGRAALKRLKDTSPAADKGDDDGG